MLTVEQVITWFNQVGDDDASDDHEQEQGFVGGVVTGSHASNGCGWLRYVGG